MALQNAHSGYEYQDIFTALRFVDVLLARTDDVTVDAKLFTGDRFDDLTSVWTDGLRTREQVKHSNGAPALEFKIFTQDGRDCRLDKLVASALADHRQNNTGHDNYEYRIVMTNMPPTDDLASALMHESTIQSRQPGFTSKCYRLKVAELWPAGGTVKRRWKNIVDEATKAGLTRDDFIWFTEHFVLELEAPLASFDLTRPGPAENILLNRLTQEVGAEIYPNADRSAIDVAARLIAAARAARAGGKDTSRKALLRRTGLRDDFGRVAKAYPVDKMQEIEIKEIANEFVAKAERALNNRTPLLVLGPPGQGKTWACDKLVRDLLAQDWLVANHYCYLNFTEDDNRNKRVRMEAIIGSLLARLAEHDPSCVDELRPRYAANTETLIAALQKIQEKNPNQRIALLIDGVDHITRVLGVTTGKIDPATELTHELALLDLPENVVLIVACQQGAHDTPLRNIGAQVYDLPEWDKYDIRALGERLHVIGDTTGAPGGVTTPIISKDDPQLDDLINELTTKAKGNALYATYCFRELRRTYEAKSQTAHDLLATVRLLPAFDGTMKAYYEYLLKGIPDEALIAAELLAILDFAVTREELKTIYPLVEPYIDQAVDRLSPVLIERGMQGGIRVYHESFQRFILESRMTDARRRQIVLQPVIDWLSGKGFLQDARAFRFLPALLAEVGNDQAVCNLIGISYVADAIADCHGEVPIMKNIIIAAEAALRLKDWPALVRYTELAKAISTYANERMDNTLNTYADIPIKLFGADWYAERLLFEARPVFPAYLGLYLCEAVDEAGGVPPWKEYLDARDRADAESDNNQQQERTQPLTEVRGILRLDKSVSAERIAHWLDQDGLPSARNITKMLLDIYQSGRLLLQVIGSLPQKRRSAYLIALAKQLPGLKTAEKLPTSAALIKRAVNLGLSPWDTVRALEMGADPNAFNVDEAELTKLTKAVLQHDAQWNHSAVGRWVAMVMLAAHTSPTALRAVSVLIQGEGWYRCWLEYVVELARYKASPTDSVIPIFKLLATDVSPFVGDPRACDLYRVHPLIATTLRLGLKHVKDEEWGSVLQILREAEDHTSTSLQGSISGPVEPALILKLVAEYTSQTRRKQTEDFLSSFFRQLLETSTYYDIIAEYHLLAARVAIAMEDFEQAKQYWATGAMFDTCYGHRKDVTVFELVDSIPDLIELDTPEARKRLARLRPLVLRVIMHTDGKETRHALPQWWGLVAQADGVAAGNLIAAEMLETPNRHAWQQRAAHLKLHLAQAGKISPVVQLASRLSLGYQPKADSSDIELLKAIKAASPQGLTDIIAADAISSLAQNRVVDDHDDRDFDAASLNSLGDAVAELGAHELTLEPSLLSRGNSDHGYEPPEKIRQQIEGRILINWGESPMDIARAIRRWSQQSYDLYRNELIQNISLDSAVEALGWRLLVLWNDGHEQTAENLLRFLGEHVSYRSPGRVMADLAQGFERHGLDRLAVIAYIMAYTKSRGGGGWRTFGGKEHQKTLQAAVALDADLAFNELGMSMINVLNGQFYGVHGISQALIQSFSGEELAGKAPANAFSLWDTAADTIETRMPAMDDIDKDSSYTPTTAENDTAPALEAAIAAAVVSGISHPERPLKRGALLGTAWLIKLAPETVDDGLKTALGSKLDTGNKTWLLWLLREFEAAPYPITKACEKELKEMAASNLLTTRVLARQLLVRAGIKAPPPPATEVKTVGNGFAAPQTFKQKQNEVMAIKHVEYLVGHRLMHAEDIVPLSNTLIEKVAQKYNQKELQASWRSQMSGLRHASSKRMPDAYTREQETVEHTLQEVAGGARLLLAKEKGLVTKPEDFEDDMAAMLIDDPELPLRVAASRIPRPKRQTILEAPGTAIDLPTVEAGPYKGWRVLGVYEKEVTPGDRYKNIQRKTVVMEGGADVFPAATAHDHSSTFGRGIGLLWQVPEDELSLWPAGLAPAIKGPLTGVEVGTIPTYFGLGVPRTLLTPHPALLALLKLTPGPILEGLSLLDEKGDKAIVARTWQTKFEHGHDFGPERPLLKGMDVLIRADLLEAFLAKQKSQVLRFCTRHHSTEDDEED